MFNLRVPLVLASGVIGGLLLLSGMATAMAQPVISATVKAMPENYSGKCPATIKFVGRVTVKNVTRPIKIQYKFTRSDGALAPVETLTFDRDGSREVSETWTLGGPGLPSYSGWEAIRIVYPQELDSNRADFSVTCSEEPALKKPKDDMKRMADDRMIQKVKEDCVSFNPARTNLLQVEGDWKIVEGSHYLFSFSNNRKEAEKALAVIKYYGMNDSCFVGRPDPSFSYLLVSGDAPKGAMKGEDCISFNPANIIVDEIQGDWKIVEGNHWIFSFGDKEKEAKDSLAIIKKHGFTSTCFVGRPDPSFKYLRK